MSNTFITSILFIVIWLQSHVSSKFQDEIILNYYRAPITSFIGKKLYIVLYQTNFHEKHIKIVGINKARIT